MKIDKIEIIRVAIPFDSGRKNTESDQQDYNAASSSVSQMETLLVAVYTDNGLCGWGEAFGHLINPVTFATLESTVAPFFLGKDFSSSSDIEKLMKQAEYAFHAFGRTGPVRYALSSIDIALWDLIGKEADLPLWKLLGGKRDRIGIYPSLVSYDNDPIAVTQQVSFVSSLGFSEIKLHETTREAVEAARNVLRQEDAKLMVDVNCPWSSEEAYSHAKNWSDLNLAWLEEPVWPPEDVDALAYVRTAGIPLAAGENAAGDGDFRHLITSGCIDIVQPSVVKVGGITAMLRVFELANQYPIRVVPHCFYYGAGMMAAAHLVSLLPESVKLEVPWVKWGEQLHTFLNFMPEMALPETPGLGFVPDKEVLQKFQIATAICSFEEEESYV